MDKDLLSSIIVSAVFVIGSAVQFVRGKTVFAIVGAVLAAFYITFTLIGYFKTKKKK